MEIENKKNEMWLPALIILSIFLLAACIYLFVTRDNTKCTECKKCDVCEEKKQCEECKTCEVCDYTNVDNSFSKYSGNAMKNNHLLVELRNKCISGEACYPIDMATVEGGKVTLTFDFDTDNGKALNSKYGKNFVELGLTDILYAKYVRYGNLGEFKMNFIFIKKDGTVYAINNNKLNSNSVETYKLPYNNIVFVSGSTSYDKIVGIDINGNIIEMMIN